MKKTLVALAAATAMCSASAASVTLYGVVDTGLRYNNIESDDYAALLDSDDRTFQMASGQRSGNRFGFKGVEELGNGLTVGFVLENGFQSDTGALKTSGTIFDREASIYLEGSFGKFGMGRLSTLNRMDNMVYYKTPNFGGAEVWLLYGMGDQEDDTVENESSRDRYYGAAVTYNNGGLSLYGAVDVLNKASFGKLNTNDVEDDQITITAAVNYDCGFAKSYLGVHWFDNAKAVGDSGYSSTGWSRLGNYQDDAGEAVRTAYGDATGWSVMAGVDIPVGNGKIKTSLGYLDASSDNAEDLKAGEYDFTRFMAAAGYEYYFSKRTTFYVGAGYVQDSIDSYADKKDVGYDPSWVQVNLGLTHKF